MPRVLFVSKPFAPPFHDGTKCLVRDVAQHLQQFEPVVMSTTSEQDARAVREWVGRQMDVEAVYPTGGSYAPTLASNARAAVWLGTKTRDKLWHFVFAPNRRSSQIGKWLRRLRQAAVVQTIASPPRSFEPSLLFGDIVVAQSSWTRARFEEAFDRYRVTAAKRPRLEVIHPPVRRPAARSRDAHLALRRVLDIEPEAPLIVYPGDLEMSGGAEAMAAVVGQISTELPGAVTVFAYRNKTTEAPRVAAELKRRLDSRAVRFTCSLPSVLDLLSGATVVAFPVDDLWGKVDLPIVLLESMALGVPVVTLDRGPLIDLRGAWKVPAGNTEALRQAIVALCQNDDRRQQVITEQQRAIEEIFDASRIAARYEALYCELTSS